MVREFAKPQEARAIEARARARCCGVRVAVIVEARRYCTPARSEPGTTYTIARTPVGWACSCPGYFYTGVCKHLGAVARRAEREGWVFGQIAPLCCVARYMPLDPPTPDPEPDPEPPMPAGGEARPRSLYEYRARGAAALADLYGDAA